MFALPIRLQCLLTLSSVVRALRQELQPLIEEVDKSAIKAARAVLEEQAREAGSVATLSKVPELVLKERVLDLLNVGVCPLQPEADLTAKPAGYMNFAWTKAVESAHKEGDEFTNGGYLRHARLLFDLNKPYNAADARAVILSNVPLSASPGTFRDLHGLMDLDIAHPAVGKPQKDKSSIKYRSFVGIELKKSENLGEQATVQARATLIALDNAVLDHFVLVVLTDLGDNWTLLWLAHDPTPATSGPRICEYQCSPTTAISIINDFVNYCVEINRHGLDAMEVPQSFPAHKFFKLSSLRMHRTDSPSVSARSSAPPPPPTGGSGRDDSRDFDSDNASGRSGGPSSGSAAGASSASGRKGASKKADKPKQKTGGGSRRAALKDVVVNGIVLNEQQREQWEDYVFREALARSHAFRDCGLINIPPPFLLEQDL